ncbi:unnamed protein product [Musa banksii]
MPLSLALPRLISTACTPHPSHPPGTLGTVRPWPPPCSRPRPPPIRRPPPIVRPPPPSGKCPVDTLKFAACANVLGGLINFEIGTPPKEPCCSLLGGLADAEAALCLCTALKTNVLGLNLNIPISLSLLVNYCGNGVPAGFQCP